MAAVENDNHYNIGKLVIKGAANLKRALKKSVDESKPHAMAALLLILAAVEGNCDMVRRVFGESTEGTESIGDNIVYTTDKFIEAQKAVMSGKVSTIVPIEIARRHGNNAVREQLLLKTDVNEQEKSVHWHGLRLMVLDISWLRRIQWVQKLRLARNGFKTLPDEIDISLRRVRVTPYILAPNYCAFTHSCMCLVGDSCFNQLSFTLFLSSTHTGGETRSSTQ